MGVDLDIKHHLSQAKLTASQYEQPVTELDAVTESTEQTNIEVLLQILNVVHRRLGERIHNNQNPFAFMVSIGEDQQLIIAFPGMENERAINENQDRNTWFGRIARLMQNEQQEMNEMRPVRRQMHRIRPLPPLPQLFPRRMQNRQNRMQQIRQRQMQMQLQQEEWIPSIDIISEPHEIESLQLPEIEQQRQVPELRLSGSIAIVEQNLNIPNQTIVQNNQDRVENILRGNDSTLDQIHLNQNSKNLIRPKPRWREEEIDEPLSCWQTFTRMIANFFRTSL